jgi:hypothetical protein
VPLSHPDALWRRATEKWAEIEAKSPDLAPAVALQKRLIRIVLDASASLGPEVSLNLDAAVVLEKLNRGVPVLWNETVPIPPHLAEFLPRLCDALADGGAGDSARRIGEAILARSIDAVSLLSVSLARHQVPFARARCTWASHPTWCGLLESLVVVP